MNKALKKRIENKLDRYIKENGIEEMSELEVGEFIKEEMTSRNRCNYYSNIRFMREVLKERGMDVEIINKSPSGLNPVYHASKLNIWKIH
jgi:hypothetical protein